MEQTDYIPDPQEERDEIIKELIEDAFVEKLAQAGDPMMLATVLTMLKNGANITEAAEAAIAQAQQEQAAAAQAAATPAPAGPAEAAGAGAGTGGGGLTPVPAAPFQPPPKPMEEILSRPPSGQ